MHQVKKVGLVLLFIVFSISNVFAQNSVSPYSAFGLGVVSEKGYASNTGMGKTGVAYASPWFVSILNPALLADQNLATFEAGVGIRNTAIRDEVNRYNQTNGGLRYLALAMPIVRNKVGIAFSLNPYISRNYSISQRFENVSGPIPNRKIYSGSGNISQFRLSAGYAINKNISVGAELNYNFGLTNTEIASQGIVDNGDTTNLPYRVTSRNTYNYSDLSYVLGLRVKKELKNKTTLAFGATYDIPVELATSKSTALLYTSVAGDPLTGQDYSQNLFSDFEGNTSIPGKLNTGLSYIKPNYWVVSVDYSYQDWSKLQQYGVNDPNLVASSIIKVGGELIPDFDDSEKYFERITYRAGFSFQNGPVMIGEQSINTFGITFGVTAPISRISNLNLAFEVGQRGTLEEGLVKENYFGINLSFTYNDNWFIRRQFD